ncbi:MAG: class I SAM-dependent methyltransferase [Pseudomonadota bacterium]
MPHGQSLHNPLPDFLDARVEPPSEVAALGLPLLPAGSQRDGLALVCNEEGLHLELRAGRRCTRLLVDFLSGALQYRAKINQARAEMLVRACGVPRDGAPWHIVDATAGLGRDAFLLAFCGAQVTLLERHPVLALLLTDALRDLALAGVDAGVHAPHAECAARLHLIAQDAVVYLPALADAARPQVVYCDPMFPPRNKSAATSGEMQVLHALIGATADAGDLLAAALHTATRRVVVKRPLRAAPLAASSLENIHPSYALSGRASRFDVYLIGTLPL